MEKNPHRLPFLMTIAKGADGRPHVDVERATASYEEVKNVRSRIIEEALFVESSLTGVILDFILGAERHREARLLRSLIFDSEFCTFMQKRRMLSKIFKICGDEIHCLTQDEGKRLRRNLNAIIFERDKFAHGRLLIDGFTYKPWIIYYRDGEQREEIKEGIAEVFREKCRGVESQLSKLRYFFKKNQFG
jgi:hypothetical protein